MNIKCPSCGRVYDALADCRMYDPKRRPLHDGMQATVLCACGKQLEVTVQRGQIRRRLPLPFLGPSWQYHLDVKER
jgi:hypothetical protein